MQLNDLFTGNIARALSWTLVHSLWMGMLLTVATGFIMLFTKKKNASLRYALLVSILTAFVIALTIVFIIEINAFGNTTINNVSLAQAKQIPNDTPLFNVNTDTNGFTVLLSGFLNRYSNMIVMVWLMLMVFRAIRLTAGIYQVKRMRTTQLSPVPTGWLTKLSELSTLLGLSKKVQFFQSRISTMPVVLGHFKPVILFPLGLITALPAAEVEAVLLHELAHIRRKDYLVNMIQQLVETILFFNPAVLWLSALIRIERENCCDDIAIALSSSKRNYINALVSFQEYQLSTPKYAIAFNNKEHLLQRVQRMLYNNNKTLNNMEKTFVMVCVAAATSLTIFFTQPTVAQTNPAITTGRQNDTVISIADKQYNPADFEEGGSYSFSEKINGISHTLYIFKRKGVLYEIYGDITSFKIDGKAIPQEQWGKYKSLINQLKKDYEAAHVAGNEDKKRAEKMKAEQLQLTNEKTALNNLLLSLHNNDSITLDKAEMAAERNKLKAELELLQKGDRSKAAQAQLLAKQDKLMAELDMLKSKQFLETGKLQLQKEQAALDMLTLKLDADTMQLKKMQSNELEKLKLELQELQMNDKIKAEQQNTELLLQKSQTEQENKILLLKKQAADIDGQKQLLMKAKEEAEKTSEKQKLMLKKSKLDLQQEKKTLQLKQQ